MRILEIEMKARTAAKTQTSCDTAATDSHLVCLNCSHCVAFNFLQSISFFIFVDGGKKLTLSIFHMINRQQQRLWMAIEVVVHHHIMISVN